MAFLLKAARPRKHPKTGVFEYRQAIPLRLRPFAKGGREEPRHEFKRSLHTKEPREAKRRLPDAIREYLKYEATLEARELNAESASLATTPKGPTPDASAAAPRSWDELRALAGGLGDELLPDAGVRTVNKLSVVHAGTVDIKDDEFSIGFDGLDVHEVYAIRVEES